MCGIGGNLVVVIVFEFEGIVVVFWCGEVG